MLDSVSFAINKLSALSGQSGPPAVTMATLPQLPPGSLNSPGLSKSEKVLDVSWSINWSCLSLPGGLAGLMKLLNEAERGHLCSEPDDHACRWHRQRTWHLGANADFTPARA